MSLLLVVFRRLRRGSPRRHGVKEVPVMAPRLQADSWHVGCGHNSQELG